MEHDTFLAFERITAKLTAIQSALDRIVNAQTVEAHLENAIMAKIDDLESEARPARWRCRWTCRST